MKQNIFYGNIGHFLKQKLCFITGLWWVFFVENVIMYNTFLLLYYVVFYAQVVNVKVYSQLQVVKRILQYTKYFSAVFSDPFWPPGSGSNSYGWIKISRFSIWIHCLIWIPLEPSPPNSCQAHGHIRIRPDPLDWDVYEAHGNGQIRFLS